MSKEFELVHAAFCNEIDKVRELLEEGLSPDVQDKLGLTALMLASLQGYMDIVKILLESNANTNVRNNSGNTALRFARKTDIANLLKQHGEK